MFKMHKPHQIQICLVDVFDNMQDHLNTMR